MKKYCLLLLLSIIFTVDIKAQISAEQEKKIDDLFESWNQSHHPGGSLGIMQNGKVVYAKAYGLASLEYLVPNSPGTSFNIASVS